MSGPEDSPADDVQPSKEDYEAWEKSQHPSLASGEDLIDYENEVRERAESVPAGEQRKFLQFFSKFYHCRECKVAWTSELHASICSPDGDSYSDNPTRHDWYSSRELEMCNKMLAAEQQLAEREQTIVELRKVAERIVEWMNSNGYNKNDQSFGARGALAKLAAERKKESADVP